MDLLGGVTYKNTNENPLSGPSKGIAITVKDVKGAAITSETKNIEIVAANDASLLHW